MGNPATDTTARVMGKGRDRRTTWDRDWEAAQFELIRHGGSAKIRKQARDNFLLANRPLVVAMATGFARKLAVREPLEDLIQEGLIGLNRAIDGFQPNKGCKFSTFAVPWIKQAISCYLGRGVEVTGKMRCISRGPRIPAHVVERQGVMRRLTRELRQQLGRSPSIAELAEVGGWSEAEVRRLLDLSKSQAIASLDSLIGERRDSPLSDFIQDQKPGLFTEAHRTEQQEALAHLLQQCPHAGVVQVLVLYFGLDGRPPQSIAACGAALGCSRSYAQKLKSKGIHWLREQIRRQQRSGTCRLECPDED